MVCQRKKLKFTSAYIRYTLASTNQAYPLNTFLRPSRVFFDGQNGMLLRALLEYGVGRFYDHIYIQLTAAADRD